MKKRKSESKPEGKPSTVKKSPVLSRRDALKIGGATLGAALLPHMAIPGPFPPEAVLGTGGSAHNGEEDDEHQWQMVIDLSRCIGCNDCVRACQAVNDVPHEDMRWNIVFHERTETGLDYHMNHICQHCQNAPCARVCPAGATWVRGDGIVVIDAQRCTGCRTCFTACPYDVRRFNWHACNHVNMNIPEWGTPEVERRPNFVVEKCTFCVQRIDRGKELGLTPGVDLAVTPACVAICPAGARIFGNLLDPESPVSIFLAEHETFDLREEWGTQPRVHYVRPTDGEV